MNSPNNTCPAEAVLSLFLAGSLSTNDDATTITHVESCKDCQAILEQLSSENESDFTAGLKKPVELSSAFRMGLGMKFGQRVADLQTRFTPGHCIGNYRIVDHLGHGAMGEVYRAKQIPLDRFVALKVIRTLSLTDDASVRRFKKSAKATGRLDHPHIVQAFDASRIDGVYYLAMELVDGMDIAVLVNALGPLQTADACEIVRQAAEGLAHGHSKGCVHRDVKPSNLMIDKEGRVKVTDFGLATLMHNVWVPEQESAQDATADGTVLGTADYMAPEQFKNPRDVDGRADVYALGCTLYKLLTGRVPFDTGKRRSIIEKMLDHQQTAPPSLKAAGVDVPPALDRLVTEMLAKSVEQRCPSAEDVATELQPLCAGAALKELVANAITMQAGGDSTAMAIPEPEPPRRTSWPATGMTIAFVLLAIVGAFAAGRMWWQTPTVNNVNEEWELILDDATAVYDHKPGTLGWRTSSLKVGYKGKHMYNEQGAETAKWTIPDLAPGVYTVYATWPQLSADKCSKSVACHLYDGDNRTIACRLNQQKPPGDVRVADVDWALAGTIEVTTGTLIVEIDARTSHGPGAARVDAIRIVSGKVTRPAGLQKTH